jgi:serine/threonine protein phosphatase PrpC
MIISKAEAMNPSRRTTMEDVCVIHQPGEWDVPDTTFVGVYDGHGGM